MKEMVELACLDLVDKHLVTNNLSLGIGYSNEKDKFLGVSKQIIETTNSYKTINEYFINMFYENVDKRKLIRRVNIGFNNVIDEVYRSYNLFDDEEKQIKEKNLQEAILSIKKKYGKNSIIKGMNLEEKATTISRNKLIGGHNEE
jgi:DNA polymerase V